MNITGTHFNYYLVCHRKLWLFASGVQMEHTSELVEMGKLIHESSYPNRSERYEEIELAGIKIDYFDAKRKVIHEIKKSDKLEPAHEWQLKYYLWVLLQHGIEGVTGILEYPKMRKTQEVVLSSIDLEEIPDMVRNIETLVQNPLCPPRVKIGICKNCSYFDFCWSGEAGD
ncbi:MAG: CRISPR-associated protein Cas4 [Bacteroidales bacterium]|nr:CRISPR-associated protein Cas4 [Bacteroidales bacterium]